MPGIEPGSYRRAASALKHLSSPYLILFIPEILAIVLPGVFALLW